MITLWKESFNNSTNYSKTIASHLNSLILNTRKDHNLLLGTLEIHIQAWDSHRNVADLKQLLRSQPRGGGVPLKLEKIWFFGVKSWFFTRNTQQNFAPPSARHNFFKCTPPNLKSWICPCSPLLYESNDLPEIQRVALLWLWCRTAIEMLFLYFNLCLKCNVGKFSSVYLHPYLSLLSR